MISGALIRDVWFFFCICASKPFRVEIILNSFHPHVIFVEFLAPLSSCLQLLTLNLRPLIDLYSKCAHTCTIEMKFSIMRASQEHREKSWEHLENICEYLRTSWTHLRTSIEHLWAPESILRTSENIRKHQ